MAWPFSKKRKAVRAHKEALDRARDKRILESQQRLLQAVELTADAAADVTMLLRAELDDSIRQFELTAGILTDGLIVSGEHHNIISMNPSAERMFQRSLDCDPICLTDIIRTSGSIQDALDGLTDDFIGLRADGQEFPIHVTVAGLERSDGYMTYLLLVRNTVDGENLKSLLTRSFGGVLLVGQGDILAANSSMTELLGYSSEYIIQQKLEDIIAAQDLPLFKSNMDNEFIDAQFDTTMVRRDGTTFPARITLTHIDWSGSPVCVITIERDEIKLNTVSGKEVIRNFSGDYSMRSIVIDRTIHPLACYLTPELNISYANQAFCDAYGIGYGEHEGLNIKDLLCSTEYETAVQHFKSLKPENPERSLTVRLHRNGVCHYQNWVDGILYDEDGNVVEYRRTGRITPQS